MTFDIFRFNSSLNVFVTLPMMTSVSQQIACGKLVVIWWFSESRYCVFASKGGFDVSVLE
jgi:hypothetical protein